MNARGFTLTELLVALGLFAVLSLIAYQGLQVILEGRARTSAEGDRIHALQTLFSILGRDLEQTISRAVRDGFGDLQPALLGDSGRLEFTRAGLRNPAAFRRSHLQRVAYRLEENRLLRLTWPVLDRAPDSLPREVTLASGIEELEFRYLDTQRLWSSQWPPSVLSGSIAGGESLPPLPLAVEVNLTVHGWGRLQRLFLLPQTIVVESQQNEAQNT